ncbi:MAG: hypothetical protein U0807_19440 [Candidatus Binatia bacterium]
MRWLASRFCDTDIQEDLGILTPAVRARKSAQDAALSVGADTAGPNSGAGAQAADSSAPGGGASAPSAAGGATAPGTAASSGPPAQPAASAMTDTPPVVPARLMGLDLGPACSQCGGMMQRTGSCYTCSSCGNNTGCG